MKLNYVLLIGSRGFEKVLECEKRPSKGERCPLAIGLSTIVFFCKNENQEFRSDDPVVLEIDATRHSPVYRTINPLLEEGYMELDPHEVDHVLNCNAPSLKTVLPCVEV